MWGVERYHVEKETLLNSLGTVLKVSGQEGGSDYYKKQSTTYFKTVFYGKQGNCIILYLIANFNDGWIN